jgi:drug/metabolite transporter (DMT)-like permease
VKTVERPKGRGILLVLLAAACWSTSGIFISLAAAGSGITAVGLAFWRDLGTFLCLLLGVGIIRPGLLRVKRKDVPWLAAAGATSIGFFHFLWNTTVLVNGVSISTVIQSTAPIFVTLMAWLLWRDPLTRRKILAVSLAAAGISLISGIYSLEELRITIFGLAVALAAAIAYGSFSLFTKKLVGSYSPWTVLVYEFGFGSLALLPFQWTTRTPWPIPAEALASYAGLVLLTTVSGFGLYTTALRRLQASVAAITANTEVLFAALLSYSILGERLDSWQVLGAVMVVGGVSLVALSQRQAPPILPREAKV